MSERNLFKYELSRPESSSNVSTGSRLASNQLCEIMKLYLCSNRQCSHLLSFVQSSQVAGGSTSDPSTAHLPSNRSNCSRRHHPLGAHHRRSGERSHQLTVTVTGAPPLIRDFGLQRESLVTYCTSTRRNTPARKPVDTQQAEETAIFASSNSQIQHCGYFTVPMTIFLTNLS
jgi:hypothetical protein